MTTEIRALYTRLPAIDRLLRDPAFSPLLAQHGHSQVVAQLRALNPDAQIILVGYTNPVPLLPEWTQLFRRLNALGKSLADQNENVTYVPIPFAMTATDAHPTVSGHKYIAKRILRAVK